MVARAMLNPPDAEPVIPARVFVVIAALTRGLWMVPERKLLIARKPGRAAITAPNPYSDPVFRAASIAPPSAALREVLSEDRTLPNEAIKTKRIDTTSAASTAHTPNSLLTS